MKIRGFWMVLAAFVFLFATSCKEKENEAGEKAEIKAKAENAEKAEAAEEEEAAEGKAAAVDLKILPEAVLNAFKAAYPNAVIKAAGKEVENGVTIFEIESLDGKIQRNITYAADGKVGDIEEAITAADLPAPVQQTLAKEFPGYKILTAETLIKDGVRQFELQIEVKDEKIDVTIDPGGKITEKGGTEAPAKK